MTTDFILLNTAHSDGAPLAVVLEDQSDLTLAELCRACAVDAHFITALVLEGIVQPCAPQPHGSVAALWRFTGQHLLRARLATRLRHDLGVNLAGAALALQLLDELQELRQAARNTQHARQ